MKQCSCNKKSIDIIKNCCSSLGFPGAPSAIKISKVCVLIFIILILFYFHLVIYLFIYLFLLLFLLNLKACPKTSNLGLNVLFILDSDQHYVLDKQYYRLFSCSSKNI